MDPRVAKVLDLIKDESTSETSLTGLAQQVNLSPSRLRFLFKSHVGVPPAQFVRTFRMERAKELLETTFLSVKQIQIRIGVSDQSHFIREFKKSYGLTPARYRMKAATQETPRILEGLLILVVYGDKNEGERLGMALEQAGACVTILASYRRALVALERMRPHLLIVDIGLKNEDPYALIRKARLLFNHRQEKIPAVALVDSNSHDPELTNAAGFQLYLPKPPQSSELIEVVGRLTGRAELSL